MNKLLLRAVDLALVVAIVAMATGVVRREFGSRSSRRSDSVGANEYLQNWEELLNHGLWVGSRDAPVKIIEFADLECPVCRAFHETVVAAKHELKGKASLVLIHFPLDQHRFARPAARALECADIQSHSGPFLDVIYSKQDSLGLKAWHSYATEAGLPSVDRFVDCISSRANIPRIEKGIALGERLGVTGTPTVILNGWRLSGPPKSVASLVTAVTAVSDGKAPFGSKGYRSRKF